MGLRRNHPNQSPPLRLNANCLFTSHIQTLPPHEHSTIDDIHLSILLLSEQTVTTSANTETPIRESLCHMTCPRHGQVPFHLEGLCPETTPFSDSRTSFEAHQPLPVMQASLAF